MRATASAFVESGVLEPLAVAQVVDMCTQAGEPELLDALLTRCRTEHAPVPGEVTVSTKSDVDLLSSCSIYTTRLGRRS